VAVLKSKRSYKYCGETIMVASAAYIEETNTQVEKLVSVFERQKNAFKYSPIPTAKERVQNLKKLQQVLVKHQSALTQALSKDFGTRHSDVSTLNDIMLSLENIKYQAKRVKKWMKPSKPHVGIKLQPVAASVHYQPKGVVGIIAPWNFPVAMAMLPLATALAAGNRAIIKPSEFTPHTAQAIQLMIEDVFTEDEVAVVPGEMEVGIEFTKLPFDHIVFTGSTVVGKHVMRAAAENLTPVTLELGGKSPAIISNNVPLKDCVERLLYGKTTNAGQICISPDYILCPPSRIDEFVETCKSVFTSFYPTIKNNGDYTSIINDRQYQRLLGHIEDAKAKGATVIEINPASEQLNSAARKLPLHLILNPTDDMICMQEEIFGPILPIKACSSVENALSYIREQPRPLSLYYFGYNKTEQKMVVENSISGSMCLNDTINQLSIDDMPFGGTGPSGMGNYHGYDGFKELSHAKSVLSRPRYNAIKPLYPPYDRFFHKLVNKFMVK